MSKIETAAQPNIFHHAICRLNRRGILGATVVQTVGDVGQRQQKVTVEAKSNMAFTMESQGNTRELKSQVTRKACSAQRLACNDIVMLERARFQLDAARFRNDPGAKKKIP